MDHRTRLPAEAWFKFRCTYCELWTLHYLRVRGAEVSAACSHCAYECREPLDDYAEHRFLSILGIQHLLEDIHPELAQLKAPGDQVDLPDGWGG